MLVKTHVSGRHRRTLAWLLSVACAGAAIGARASASASSTAAGPSLAAQIPVDADHDGIPEDLEQKLAERFAPVIYIEPDESNYPVNVDWFLDRANLQYHEDCTGDVDDNVGPFPVGRQLLGPQAGFVWAGGPNCGEDDTGYGHPPHRQLTTVAADPDGQFSVGALTTGYSDQQTFVLNDLNPFFHVGSTDPRDWKTYFHAYPSGDGGVMIQYWHVFAFNEFGGGFDDHGGDWDASIQVWLNPDLTLRGVWFSRHADDHPGTFFCASTADCGSSDVRLFDGTHPVVTIDGGGHAAFRSPADWATCDCRVLESVTGPLGTIVWTRDSDRFDDPSALRRAEFVCPANGVCTLTLSEPSGGIVWKTWSDGDVVASGHLTNPIVAPSAHGGLVNLGEYNPCTSSAPFSCFGTAQASQLLAGEFHPLNDAFWLRYEGRWGSIGTINSGPRGPVFQGFEDRGPTSTSVYRAWYNNGADTPAADDGHHPWRVPPTTSAALEGATHVAGGVTFVAGTTQIALTAHQSAIADRFGTATIFVRVHPAGGSVPEFTPYGGPFTIPSLTSPAPDGAYTIEYFTVDALGNADAPAPLALTLDTTPPAATITQPAATMYAHSASLTLAYSVADGAGSGVATAIATLDGAAMLPDGTGLASGQTIDLLTQLALGSHTFAIASTDHVGNSATQTVQFSIVVTASSIKDDVAAFLATGRITNHGVATSLLAKLDAAAAAGARGDCDTASNVYRAFINELGAQAGKAVDPTAAAVMIGDADFLIANCR